MRTQAELFLTKIFEEIQISKIDMGTAYPDHICYRVATDLEYSQIKEDLNKIGKLLAEVNVNGRPISTFKLFEPIKYQNISLDLIELPAPKNGKPYHTGFEHIEFVIKESFQTFLNRNQLKQHKISGNLNLNPELQLNIGLKSGQIKLHYQPLDRIIQIEESQIKDIFFDLDGTLIDSRQTIYKINQKVFSQVLNREVSMAEIQEKFETEFKKLFHLFGIDEAHLQQKAMTLWGQIALEYSYDLFADTQECLTRLNQAGFRLHIWTARDTQSTYQILKSHKLDHLFKTISSNDGLTSKPNPQNLKLNFSALEPNSFLMVGDSKTDMIASRNIQAISVAALWDPYIDLDSVINAGQDMSFNSLSDLANWLIKDHSKTVESMNQSAHEESFLTGE